MISFQVNRTHNTWLTSGLVAFIGHALVLALLFLNPNFRIVLPEKVDVPEVRLVRLKGGGENRPGWIKPTTAPSDNSPVADAKPKPVVEPKEEPIVPPKLEPVETVAEKTTLVEEVKQVVEETVAVENESSTIVEDEDVAAADPIQVDAVVTEETGEGVGDKAGPEGAGLGIHSDAIFPGADVYLSRVEVEVQRRFNFRGRGSGVMSEYHFNLDKKGKIKELILMKTSGIPSLDLAARSALLRAKFPPLPPSFNHDKLGVTYRFYDAK